MKAIEEKLVVGTGSGLGFGKGSRQSEKGNNLNRTSGERRVERDNSGLKEQHLGSLRICMGMHE